MYIGQPRIQRSKFNKLTEEQEHMYTHDQISKRLLEDFKLNLMEIETYPRSKMNKGPWQKQ